MTWTLFGRRPVNWDGLLVGVKFKKEDEEVYGLSVWFMLQCSDNEVTGISRRYFFFRYDTCVMVLFARVF